MEYNGTIYRPPIEANTFLIPLTEGCSHNSCHFCSMYKDVPFRMWPTADVEAYMKGAKERYGWQMEDLERVYLIGADPFVLSAKNLIERIDVIKKYLPKVKVITMYARIENIAHKSDDDLKALKAAGVNDLYIGIESGLTDILEYLNKGYTIEEIREQCLRLNAVGIRHSDLLMLGTGGRGRGQENALAMAKLENEIKPTQILVNTMSAFAGTKLDDDIKKGVFIPAEERENLEEEKTFLEHLELPDTYFWALHPLDSVRIDGILKKDKQRMIAILDDAITNARHERIQRTARRGTL